ncbi:MAG: DUF2293 domain-containing protein [Acidobacteriota bacterium]|nr:DUF2293 domain-containing protein [Acidobacteriota bacterium]
MLREKVRALVHEAAEEALAERGFVNALDVLTGARILHPTHIVQWRRGLIDSLEQIMQGGVEKIAFVLEAFAAWVAARHLKPVETAYVRNGREGSVDLRFTKGADPAVERVFRTHWVPPGLAEAQQERIKEKLEKPERPTVFQIVRDSECSECGTGLDRDDLLFLDAGQALCLACAKMDDLEFLPAGDTALTRRATKYSARPAVVVRFSRSRGRYERQGILAEPAAIERAEQECADDAGERAQERRRAAEARVREDRDFTERMASRIREIFPGCPPEEARPIAVHTAQRGSGRVGRTAAGRALEEKAVAAAVTAAVRHRHTNYDSLLASGLAREDARRRVRAKVDDILDAWR